MKEALKERIEYLYYHTSAGPIFFILLCVLIPLTGNIITAVILLVILSLFVAHTTGYDAFIPALFISSIISFISFTIYDNYSAEVYYSETQPAKIKAFTSDESHIVVDINGSDKLIVVSKAEFYKMQSKCKPVYKTEYTVHYYGDTTSQIVLDCIK